MPQKNAYQVGYEDGSTGARNDRFRKYQTKQAEIDYWKGYLDAVIAKWPGKMIVQCEREGKIFPVLTTNPQESGIDCPVCGRRYLINENGDYESDRKLTILKA